MSKEDDGRRLLCTNCEELTGKGTGLPSLRCSRCQAANYCSAACQRAHWKAHKVHCKLHQQKQTRDDEHALSNPQLAAMKADLVSFDSDINFALCGVAYRSAFQLGHPGQCNDTHYLDLWFSWDSKPKERRDRFKLHWAGLRKFEDAEIELRKSLAKLNPSLGHTNEHTASVTHHHRSIDWGWYCLLPLDERHLNPNWITTFKRVMADPSFQNPHDFAYVDLKDSNKEDYRKGFLRLLSKLPKPSDPSDDELNEAFEILGDEMKARARGEK